MNDIFPSILEHYIDDLHNKKAYHNKITQLIEQNLNEKA